MSRLIVLHLQQEARDEGSVEAALCASRRQSLARGCSIPGTGAAFERLGRYLDEAEDPLPAPDDLSTLDGARAALRSASYAAMISAHDLTDVDESQVEELEADLDAQLARALAARMALRTHRGQR